MWRATRNWGGERFRLASAHVPAFPSDGRCMSSTVVSTSHSHSRRACCGILASSIWLAIHRMERTPVRSPRSRKESAFSWGGRLHLHAVGRAGVGARGTHQLRRANWSFVARVRDGSDQHWVSRRVATARTSAEASLESRRLVLSAGRSCNVIRRPWISVLELRSETAANGFSWYCQYRPHSRGAGRDVDV